MDHESAPNKSVFKYHGCFPHGPSLTHNIVPAQILAQFKVQVIVKPIIVLMPDVRIYYQLAAQPTMVFTCEQLCAARFSMGNEPLKCKI